MSESYEPAYTSQTGIYIEEIIFEKDVETTDVTLFGSYEHPFCDEPVKRDYLCQFDLLTDLLLAAGENCDELLAHIADKISDDDRTYPTIINVPKLTGASLFIPDISLSIYKPQEKNDAGAWQELDDEVYFIEAIEKVAGISPQQESLSDQLLILENAFRYFEALVAGGCTKKKARKKAGLKNKMLYRIAILNHKIITEL